jgi:hypothetical protein
MNYCSAAIHHIRNIAFSTLCVWFKQGDLETADDNCRIFDIQKYSSQTIAPHRSDTMGDYKPARRGFNGRSAVPDFYRFPKLGRAHDHPGLAPEINSI